MEKERELGKEEGGWREEDRDERRERERGR